MSAFFIAEKEKNSCLSIYLETIGSGRIQTYIREGSQNRIDSLRDYQSEAEAA